ncbi:Mini-ribonuclease 3 [uncultured Ruminococcus sp.]|uniref:Mini-ribonuclease 3 n=1 Tax=uncultured Ruminococcus sp. TaxID=165186 RepID=UPI00266D0CA6|nr:ribonuclease III domain-containing protein [uncultured Ruminococcus sp.]
MEPLTQAQARQYSPLALAFLGDSVYEILVREYLVREANRPAAKLHEQKIQLVCAAFQAQAIDRLIPLLTEEETAVYKRGRNANNTVPRHTSAQDYHKATGLEALFGYLHLLGERARLEELFAAIFPAE